MITPAGRLNTSQGSRLATDTSPISSGLRVTAEASHGYAMSPMPSPTFETRLAENSFQ